VKRERPERYRASLIERFSQNEEALKSFSDPNIVMTRNGEDLKAELIQRLELMLAFDRESLAQVDEMFRASTQVDRKEGRSHEVRFSVLVRMDVSLAGIVIILA
jgi:hypothetical protein